MPSDRRQPWWRVEGWDTESFPLWLVERWSGKICLFGGSGFRRIEDAHAHLRESEWLGSSDASVFLLARESAAVRSFEMRIASRRSGNRPDHVLFKTRHRELSWTYSPSPFVRSVRWTHDDLEQSICHPFLDRSDACPLRTRLWGCVTEEEELLLLTARTLSAACRLASDRLGRDVSVEDVEPVERIQLELALMGGAYRPTRYSLWVFDRTIARPVGSPPSWSPLPPSPRRPPAVEARLPIPTYTWTDAVGGPHPAIPRVDGSGPGSAS